MNRQFIMTNRPVHKKAGREQIDTRDRAANSLNLRFGYYDPDTKVVTLIPDVPLEGKRFIELDYSDQGAKSPLHGSAKWFRDIYTEMAATPEKNDTLVFIHGFACGFNCLIENLDHLYQTYVQDPASHIARVVAFSWPSNDKLTQYAKDKNDADFAGVALARGFQKLMQFFQEFFKDYRNERCGSQLHLMCHSMGNQVLESMIKNLLESSAQFGQVFKEIILAAPDLGNDVFEKGKPLSRIMDFGERVHVYIHNRDKALVISHLTKNWKARLGKTGPSDPFSIPSNVSIVDASAVKDQITLKEQLVDHWYYKKSDTIIRDIREVLNGSLTFSQRKASRNHNNYFEIKG